MVVVDGVVNGFAIVGFGCAVAMVGDCVAAGFWAKVSGSAAAGYVVVVFDTCLFLHALMHDADLQFDDQSVVFVCRGLNDE